MSKADDIISEYSYDRWYISGHSLGGAMAASFAAGHTDELDGVIMLLIPAFIFGFTAVMQIVHGSNVSGELLLPRNAVLFGSVAVYVILLAATAIFLKRQVTTERLLIVGWPC